MSVKPIPEGYTSLTPFLCIDGASAAIDFYMSVFGASSSTGWTARATRSPMPNWISATAACSCRIRNEAYQIAAAEPEGVGDPLGRAVLRGH